jgi:tetratricopeptide (TPR) repeat protein
MYRSMDQHGKAEQFYKQLLFIVEKLYTDNNNITPRILRSLAMVYSSMGRIEEAKLAFQRSLAIFRKS